MNDELKCLDCDSYIDYDDKIDDEFDGSFYNSLWEGHCPECDKRYRWKEIYKFNCVEDFEEKEGE